MAARNTPRLRTQKVHELCRHFELSPAATPLLLPDSTTSTLLSALVDQGHWFDAATLLAHGMQKREAVWWACLICRDHFAVTPVLPAAEAAITVAEQWVKEPQEKLRLATHHAALKAGNRSPAYWAAMAVFWCTGNMTPHSGVDTPSPPFMYARAVAAAIDLAAALAIGGREKFYQQALARGLDLVAGGDGSARALLAKKVVPEPN